MFGETLKFDFFAYALPYLCMFVVWIMSQYENYLLRKSNLELRAKYLRTLKVLEKYMGSYRQTKMDEIFERVLVDTVN